MHPYIKILTGTTISIGKGSIYSTSVIHNLYPRSSTEYGEVLVDDFIPMILWRNYFLGEQGYSIDTDILQDNQSSILRDNNGISSSGKQNKHINIRYFFVADRVKFGDVNITYCQMDYMVRDYFTKPLQGDNFS